MFRSKYTKDNIQYIHKILSILIKRLAVYKRTRLLGHTVLISWYALPKAVADEGGWGAVASSVSGSVAVVAVGTVMSINSVVSHSRVGYRLVVHIH